MWGSPAVGVAVAATTAAMLALLLEGSAAEAAWCIAQSSVSAAALQTALDYACGPGGGDCLPIQASGLCYLPNTLPAHASYAFNSVFQRSGAAPGACDFAGTATVSITDPSYGSCTYPSSRSTAGGSTSTGTPNNSTPTDSPFTSSTPLTPPGLGGTVGGLTPDFGPPVPNYDTSSAAVASPVVALLLLCSIYFFLLLIYDAFGEKPLQFC